MKNEDERINTIDELNFFTHINLKNYLDNEFNESEIANNSSKAIICGKFFPHKLNNKYNFQACEFVIYHPALKNTLFYSEMLSEDCFTNSLKWNENFFKKVRMSFSDHISKSSYFGIYYERPYQQETNNNNLNSNYKKLEIQINNENADEEEEDLFKDFDFGDDKKFENKMKYLELHFLVGVTDLIAFRLNLKEVYDENPVNTILIKALEFEKNENSKLLHKQKQFSENEMEIVKLKNTLEKKEMLLEKQKREFIYKFYLLNKEKNKKINEFLSKNNASNLDENQSLEEY